MPSSWISDTIPSLPNQPELPPQIDLGAGFVFTTGGLAHAVSRADVEELIISMYSPQRPPDG